MARALRSAVLVLAAISVAIGPPTAGLGPPPTAGLGPPAIAGLGPPAIAGQAVSPSPSPSASPPPVRKPKLSAAAAILEDLDSGQRLFSKAPDERRPIASLTKVMTALVVLSSAHLDDVVVVPPEAVGQIGSNVGLRIGERLTVRDLLYGMLLPSANDAAVALARSVGGTVGAFVGMMNATASRMGLRDTHFASPTGLDNSGYSTAADLAALTRRAYGNETFTRVVATVRKRIPGPGGTIRRLVNRNILLRVYPGAIGVKSGFTTPAGFCLIGAARLNGLGLLAVVLGSRTSAFDDAIHLLNYGFGAFERVALVSKGQRVGGIEVDGRRFDALAGRDVVSVARRQRRREVELRFKSLPVLPAVVQSGDVIGRIDVLLNGEVFRVIPALAAPVVTAPAPAPSPPRTGSAPANAVERALLFLAAIIRAALNAFL